MTLTTKPTVRRQPEPDVATPRLRTRLRRNRFWILAAVFAVGIALVLMFATRGASIDAALLSPGNQTPNGGRALAQVLRQEGVTVTETTTLDATLEAIEDTDSTVLLFDPSGLLDASQLERLSDADAGLVVVTPRAAALRPCSPASRSRAARTPPTSCRPTAATPPPSGPGRSPVAGRCTRPPTPTPRAVSPPTAAGARS